MTYTIIYLMAAKPDLSFDQFKSHYEDIHIPLVKACLTDDVAPLRHTRHYIQRDDADPAAKAVFMGDASAVDFDCITFIEFRDEGHFNAFNKAFMASPRLPELMADQAAFADVGRFRAVKMEAPRVMLF